MKGTSPNDRSRQESVRSSFSQVQSKLPSCRSVRVQFLSVRVLAVGFSGTFASSFALIGTTINVIACSSGRRRAASRSRVSSSSVSALARVVGRLSRSVSPYHQTDWQVVSFTVEVRLLASDTFADAPITKRKPRFTIAVINSSPKSRSPLRSSDSQRSSRSTDKSQSVRNLQASQFRKASLRNASRDRGAFPCVVDSPRMLRCVQTVAFQHDRQFGLDRATTPLP